MKLTNKHSDPNTLPEIDELKGDVLIDKTNTNENPLTTNTTNCIPLYSVKGDKNNDNNNKNEVNFMGFDEVNINFYKEYTKLNKFEISDTENNFQFDDDSNDKTPKNTPNDCFDNFSDGPGDPEPPTNIMSVGVAPQHVVKHGSNGPSSGLTKVSC